MGNEWLKPVLAQGVAMLLVLRLKNSPAEDSVKATLQAWFQVITYKKQWDQSLDKARFESAFMLLSQTCDWFPTPKQLLEIMPPRELKELPPPILTEEQRQKNLTRVREMLDKMKRGMLCNS